MNTKLLIALVPAGAVLASLAAQAMPAAVAAPPTLVAPAASNDGASLPGARGGKGGAPGRLPSAARDPARVAALDPLRGYCVDLLMAGPGAPPDRADRFRPSDCADLFAGMAAGDDPTRLGDIGRVPDGSTAGIDGQSGQAGRGSGGGRPGAGGLGIGGGVGGRGGDGGSTD